MDNDAILGLYEWGTGTCFRCARTGVDTAAVKRIRPQAGAACEVRACRACTLDLEAERRRDAVQHGRIYVPGIVVDDEE